MADSDNTTALPFVILTRRKDSCAVTDATRSDVVTSAAHLRGPVDPCVRLLQDWGAAHHMVVVLCRLQQRLELRMKTALGFSEPSPGQIDTSKEQRKLWDALDSEVGYSRARAAEQLAIEAEEELLETVSTTSAQSLAGVIAKLNIIVGAGETMEDMSSFPWPQIQSVLTDLNRLRDSGHARPPARKETGSDSQPGGGGRDRTEETVQLGMPATGTGIPSRNQPQRR